ncbi:hypothetical protein WAJ11_22275, partial [Acinetobacter baumannii]
KVRHCRSFQKQTGVKCIGIGMVRINRMPERAFLLLFVSINISTAKAKGMGKDAMDVELKRCK